MPEERVHALLRNLNPPQREAVQATDGPVLVLAGPGSGKTRVLTHRVAYLISVCGIDPYHIMAVTFTNKAAREMKTRLVDLIGPGPLGRLTIGTFHAICARILRREADRIGLKSSFVIYDDDDQLRLIRQALKDLNLDEKMYRPRAIQNAISKAKSALVLPEEYSPPTYWHEIAGRVYRRYQELLSQNNALDFDDLLMLTARTFQRHEDILAKYRRRYQYLLVDEFQDTDACQYTILRMIATQSGNLFVVGDEDQSVYSWRGADFRNVHRFQQDYPQARVILLEQNYRSSQVILDAARYVISLNTQRTDKKLWTENPEGPQLTIFEAYDEQEEADYVVSQIEELVKQGECRLKDCAVMYRTNAQSRVIEDAFVRHNLPYKLVGATRFYERREIKDVLAYLRLLANPFDGVSLERVINVPPRGIGQTTIHGLERWAAEMNMPIYTALQLLAAREDGAVQDDLPVPPLDTRGQRALVAFYNTWQALMAARQEKDVLGLLDEVLEVTGYADYVRDGTDEGEDRWANIMELRTVAREYEHLPPAESLTTFLEEVALVSDVDNLDEAADAPTLLTLHTAKGLEFYAVFIVGMEEGLFPHSRSMDEPDEMEEERRLCYVGITRAKRRLYLVHTFRRTMFGMPRLSEPSRFLADIPARLVEGQEKRAPARPRLPEAPHPPAFPSFRAGDRVRHPQFGEGIVVSSEVQGADERVTVAFVSGSIKRLMASFAHLQRLN
ncbi:MAG: UvrD-helicase domain-containing protein [Chloroflexi bacterium]|nr:UvrD-helicase domain-containing protein [Chloroflexota bacterium]